MTVDTQLRTDSVKNQRYLGNTRTRQVHDLLHEDPGPKGCAAYEAIQAGEAVRFDPDRLRKALAEGYEPCPKCLHRLDSRRTYFTRAILKELGNEDADID